MEKQEVKQNLSNCKQWTRVLFMFLFAMIFYIVLMVFGLVVVVQIVFSIFTGKPNDNMSEFSDDLAAYINQLVSYLLYKQELKPYPFSAWGQQDKPKTDDDEIIIEDVEVLSDEQQNDENKT